MDFSVVLDWYIYILPPFILQLAIMEGLFCRHLRRKPWFLLRLAASGLVCAGALWFAACAIVISWALPGVPASVVYLALFLLTVVVMKMCLDEPFSILLFYGVAAYAAQNLAHRIYSLLELYGAVWALAPHIGPWRAYLLVWWMTFAVVGAVVFAVFARPTARRDAAHLRDGKIYALSCVTLVITIFLCTWTNVYAWESRPLTTIIYLFSCFCCTFVLGLQSGMLQTEGLRHDLEVVKQLWEQDRKQYELSRENIDIINIKCHDLRFRLQSLRTTEGEISKEELEEIENAITIYDSRIATGCEPLDTILTEKSLYCSKNGIRFNCMADGSKLSFMAPADIYSLFGNVISNAVEAVRKVEDSEYRVITFVVRQVGEMLLVEAENYYAGTLTMHAGALVTSKEDKVNHGYGMKSIQMLAKKYGGDVDLETEDNIFTIKILFPYGD